MVNVCVGSLIQVGGRPRLVLRLALYHVTMVSYCTCYTFMATKVC